jgi:hypothetical protein
LHLAGGGEGIIRWGERDRREGMDENEVVGCDISKCRVEKLAEDGRSTFGSG